MEDKTLNFELTVAQANAVLQALANAPYSVAAPIIELMQKQATSQLASSENTVEDPSLKGN